MNRDDAGRDTPIVLIGIDAGDIDLIEHWAAEGHLPAFADLLAGGAHGRLATTATVVHGSVWNSIATGCHPGKHGSYYRIQMRNGKNEFARVGAEHCFRLPFWAWFECEQEQAVIVDFPKMPPLPWMNGLQVVEWGAFDHLWEYATSPADAAGGLLAEFGQHPLLEDFREAYSVGQSLDRLHMLVEGVEMKQRLVASLLARHEPRVLVSVFGEAHPAGHYLWRFHDPAHPDHVPHDRLRSGLRDVYAAIDRAIGDLLTTCDGSANVLVVSGHGVGPDYNPYHLLPDLLYRMGMTVAPGAVAQQGRPPPVGLKRRLRRAVRNAIPVPLRRRLLRSVTRAADRERMQLRSYVRDIDFGRSKAFCLATDLQGFIRLNLKGREPTGIVSPEEYDAICDEIEAAVLSLENAATGKPVVEKVHRPRELYGDGDQIDQLPDLCVQWRAAEPVPGVRSPEFGELSGERRPSGRSGNHRPHGFFFAVGPDIDTAAKGTGGSIMDIAPTVFRLMGRPIPEDWDGAPLPVIR